MAERYPGGYITKNPPAPTSTAAPGVWTLEQAMQNVKAGTWPPNGPYFIEDVFSTYLYTGNGTGQTITNNIDLSTKGGLLWIKGRSPASSNNVLYDTVRGAGKILYSNLTNAQSTNLSGYDLTAFTTSGFTLGTSQNTGVNSNGDTSVSWTFREQPKFFDVVTYTGNGTDGRAIAHNLGSVPGFIVVKATSTTAFWTCWHNALTATQSIYLNSTAAAGSDNYFGTTPTSSNFYVRATPGNGTNENGVSYVAYLFAHDAGGFGLTGSDNVISCGSVTTGSSGYTSVNLGYEPQWVMVKTSAVAGSWVIVDNMRGFPVTGNSPALFANNSSAEDTARNDSLRPTATGFDINADFYGSSRAFIYIAIRRGPMKTPTTGTSVFAPVIYTGNSSTQTTTTNFPVDLLFQSGRNTAVGNAVTDRLRGPAAGYLATASTGGDNTSSGTLATFDSNTGNVLQSSGFNQSSFTYVDWSFRRAPGFFDEVCYTGNGVTTARNHNLGVSPELLIIKRRNTTGGWVTYNSFNGANQIMYLDTTAAVAATSNVINSVSSTTFTVGSDSEVNANTSTYVAYLFASVAGVSKVGSYTGNGTNQTINCGFTGGSRFVLIKRTDSTGGWYVWDSARGIVAGNDPYLLLNSTAAEVTTNDSVDTDNSGFVVNQLAATNINVNAATYIFLAIA